MEKIISGIQQVGIGVPDLTDIWPWYRKYFGQDIKIFREEADAELMTRYTGGEVHRRDAALAVNLESGGGFEIWEFKSKDTRAPSFDVKLGDYGIYIVKLKSRDVIETYNYYKREGLELLSAIETDPNGRPHFYMRDPHENIFEIVEGKDWLFKTNRRCGGVYGAVLGVSDIERSLPLYSDVLGYRIVYDREGIQDDFRGIPGGHRAVRRVLLKSGKTSGPFAKLLGPSQLELVELKDGTGRKIFKDRYWGDKGFIHLCYDVKRMDALKRDCEEAGFHFTVDSKNTFEMNDAGGRFSYIEDPDGTLIEFVETHRLPLIEQIGWYLNLNKRDHEKPLPRWMLYMFGLKRIRD